MKQKTVRDILYTYIIFWLIIIFFLILNTIVEQSLIFFSGLYVLFFIYYEKCLTILNIKKNPANINLKHFSQRMYKYKIENALGTLLFSAILLFG